jgi:LuxR family maltose regulon positive regulatory protein
MIASRIEGIVANSPDGPERGKLAAYLKTLQLCIAYMSDDIPLMLALAEGFISGAGEDDHWPRIVVSNAMIHGNLIAGEIDKARGFEPLGLSEIDDPNELFSAAYQICLLGLCDVAELKLLDAEARFRRAYGLAEKNSGRKTAVTALCASLLAAVSYEHGRIEEAETLVFGRLELIEQTGFVEALQACYVTLARIHAARHNWKVAHLILDRGVRFARRRNLVRLRGACLAERVEISLQQGHIGKAQTLLSELGWIVPETDIASRSGEAYVRQLHLHASGLVALARGKTGDACRIFRRLASSQGWDDYAILRARIQMAVALEAEGKLLQAQDEMREALLAGAAGGLLRSFLDAGPAARALVRMVLPRLVDEAVDEVPAGHLERLIAALDREDPDAPETGASAKVKRQAQAATLTDREFDLLSRIRQGLTNKEIAADLGIGVETVKWHLKNVFGKLKVSNRAEAVACTVGDARRS